ncbi:MAG: SPOR domain-containing protein [Moraxellaceae bacterium]
MEKAIKQRLLGGLVLAAGAALFLPLVLDGAGSDLVMPPPPAPPVLPAPESLAPALEAEVAAAEQAVAAAQSLPDEAQREGEPAAPPEALLAAPATSAVVAPPAQAQAQAQARAEQERLAREKAAADAERLEKERQARLAAEARARADAEQKARDAAAKAAVAKPAPAPAAAPAVAADLPQAWVVQVASLSTRDKADALAQRLRQKGYRAMVRGQEGAWKVLVGPELNRAVADTIKQKLADDSELRLSGWVQAWKP